MAKKTPQEQARPIAAGAAEEGCGRYHRLEEQGRPSRRTPARSGSPRRTGSSPSANGTSATARASRTTRPPPRPGIVAQPQPPDPYLAFQTLQANQNITLGDADASYQQGELGRSSGFDATGNLIQQGSAAFSPYSQAMLLQDQFKRNQAGTQNSYAAQGQYNSGAYGRAKERDSRLYGQDYDALKTSAQQGYHGINQGRLSTYANNALGTGQGRSSRSTRTSTPGASDGEEEEARRSHVRLG
jgi:hypothetical protein